MRSYSKIRFLIVFLVFFVLQGCKQDSTTSFIDNIGSSIVQSLREIKNYNYDEFFAKIKTAYKTNQRKRYPISQKIVINTSRDGQIYAYNGVIKECELFSCKIKYSFLDRDTVAPENTIAKLEMELPLNNAKQFDEAISKYGKIVKNEVLLDDNIVKDLDYYNAELMSLNLLKIELETILLQKNIYNSKEIERFERNLYQVNNQILYTQNDIKYLDEIKDKQKIDILIHREYHSTSNKVKVKIQNSIKFITEYLHIFIIFAGVVALYKLFKYLLIIGKNFYKTLKNKTKVRKNVKQEHNKEPQLPTN